MCLISFGLLYPNQLFKGPGGSMSQVVGLLSNSYKPITNTAWVCTQLCKLQKGCIRLAAENAKVYQLFAHGRWFSPCTPASFTTKIGRHDIDEILLKVVLNTKNQNQSSQTSCKNKYIKYYNRVYHLSVNLVSKNTYLSKPRKKKINGTFLVMPVFIICRHGGLKQN